MLEISTDEIIPRINKILVGRRINAVIERGDGAGYLRMRATGEIDDRQRRALDNFSDNLENGQGFIVIRNY